MLHLTSLALGGCGFILAKKVSVTHVLVSFITGSYDRTCKVWETASGEELLTLEGHKNVVYAVAFNNPYGLALIVMLIVVIQKLLLLLLYFFSDKIATGSFDKTCKVNFL